VLLALPVGILIGLSLGALGGGGSILTVPALVYLLGETPHGATTASLIIVGVTSLVAMAFHLRAGRVRVRSGVVFGVLGAGGAFVGSRLSASINPSALLAAFAVLMAGAAAAMLYRQRCAARAAAGERSRPSPAAQRISPVRVVVAATIVGLVTGFFGVGGGFVVVPALVLALGFDMPTAIGTSLLVIVINSVSALLSRLGTHATVNATVLIAFTVAAVAGAVAGSRISSRVRPERLTAAFAYLMIAIALYTAARSIPALA
jgi:uncharacterized membrane protein YfcA